MNYIVGIDQSTQGTKALLFDEKGTLLCRCDRAHEQIINEKGWVSHDLLEIYANTIQVFKDLIEKSGIQKEEVAALGISNQRETTACWNKKTGLPVGKAIVWQCGRAEAIGQELIQKGYGELFRSRTGIPLSGYFPACKMAWFLQNEPEAGKLAKERDLCLGTMDAWLVYKLTGGHSFKTDYSNASRTQLFNLKKLRWDEELTGLLGIPMDALPEVTFSDSLFGYTDFDGYLDQPIPIHGVLGDSHAALFGQGCLEPGMVKATYGTGSSLMMNTGFTPYVSHSGVVTSIAWAMNKKVLYCLEGNLNYTGATISWLKNDLGLISSSAETQELAYAANPEDSCYLVPAFTGLGAPYWKPDASAVIVGMTRTTRKAEIVKAALESIAYQITDLIQAMEKDTGASIQKLRVDGGPTRNTYLMQFQSDISGKKIQVPQAEELSGIGAAYCAGIGSGIYSMEKLHENVSFVSYEPRMKEEKRKVKYTGWKNAVKKSL